MHRLALPLLLLLAAPALAQQAPAPAMRGDNITVIPSGSSAARSLPAMLGDVGNVLAFGALCDGVTDDTAAFNAALAAKASVMVPPGRRCVVGDVIVPSNRTLFSWNPRSEIVNNTQADHAWLLAKSGTPRVLNVAGTVNVAIIGLAIDGINGTPNCISAGSVTMLLDRVLATRCNNGVGGAVSGATGHSYAATLYTSAANITFSTFRSSVVGIAGLIDSVVMGGAVTANQFGVAPQNANTLIGLRAEWNTIAGVDCFSCGNLTIIGGLMDRNYYAGLRVIQNTAQGPVTVIGTLFRRNGRNNIAGQDAHIVIDTASRIRFTGITTETGRDDGGGGPLTPAYVVRYTNTVSDVGFAGSTLTGFVTAATAGTEPVYVGSIGASGSWFRGAGSPEGVVTAPIGSFYQRTDGGAGTSIYIKESGSGNTGWVAK